MKSEQVLVCRHCGREITQNPYLGDVNPDHVRQLVEPDAPSLEILHGSGREYDTFCNKEHYLKWLQEERHRLPAPPAHADSGPIESL